MRSRVDNLQDAIKQSLVRIYNGNDRIVGSGFLVSDSLVLTCAHVVDQAESQGEVTLEFPFVGHGQMHSAWVASRQPPHPLTTYPPPDGLDIALLRLRAPAPAGSRAARLVRGENMWGQPFRTFGFPPRHDDGVWVEGLLRDEQTRGLVELDRDKHTGYFIAPGFSGSAVWSEAHRGVVGMVVAADREVPGSAAFMLPTRKVLEAVPMLAASDAGRQVISRGSWLLLLPALTAPEARLQQEEDVEHIIQPAISKAGLVLAGKHSEGLRIDDLNADWIPLIAETEVVIVDLNRYGPASEPALAPYLCYFLGLRHSCGSDTILVTRSEAHLPYSLQRRPHTLIYNPTRPASVRDFTDRFAEAVRKILARAQEHPDNPIQEYRERLARDEETERLKGEKEALERQVKRQRQVVASPPPEVSQTYDTVLPAGVKQVVAPPPPEAPRVPPKPSPIKFTPAGPRKTEGN